MPRNRAKCKLCRCIIESFHPTDYVMCNCGEIFVDAGEALKCGAKKWDNFLRIDDNGNEIVIKIKEEINDVKPLYNGEKPTKKQLIEMLDEMANNIEKLPQHAMTAPITHYDHWSLITLLSAILRSD